MKVEFAWLESLWAVPQWGKRMVAQSTGAVSQITILITLHCNEKLYQEQQVSRTLVSFHFQWWRERQHSLTVMNSCIQQPFQLPVTRESKSRIFLLVVLGDIKCEQMNEAAKASNFSHCLFKAEICSFSSSSKIYNLNSAFLVFLFVPYFNVLKAITDMHL